MIGDPVKHGYESSSNKTEYLKFITSFLDELIESRVRIVNIIDTKAK